MKLYISTHKATDGFPQWYGEAPNSELKSLMNTLPAKDRKNSLAIERTGRGTCRLALKRLIAQDDCLIIDQLEEHEARSLASAYLLKRDEMRASVAACIHGAEADLAQLERALRGCMTLAPVQTDAPPKYQKLVLPTTPDAAQKAAARLHDHRLINGAGLKIIISDAYSMEDLQNEDIDVALCGTCPVSAPRGNNNSSTTRLWLTLGAAALLLGIILYRNCGSSSSEPDSPKDSPVRQPLPTAAQEGE